jgi:hypothetical protein
LVRVSSTHANRGRNQRLRRETPNERMSSQWVSPVPNLFGWNVEGTHTAVA